MRLRLVDLSLHLARLALVGFLLFVAARCESLSLAVLASALGFFGSFALMHDLAHGALRLPRKWNEIALAAAGLLLLMSGHALRRMHHEHHAAPLGDDDLEGQPARGSFGRALLDGPRASIVLRVEAYRRAASRGRVWQSAETLASLVALALLVASSIPALRIYAAVAVALQLSMGVWAAHIPHNTPAWIVRLAEKLAWSGSPTVLALAYHERHHARPDVPCQRLASL